MNSFFTELRLRFIPNVQSNNTAQLHSAAAALMSHSDEEVWVVTGANRGIGLEYVQQILSLPNSKVVAAARSPAKAVHLQDLQKQHEGRLTLVALDLSETSTAQAAAEEVAKLHGQVDYLINNAGVLGKFAQVVDQELEDLKNVLMVNVVGTYAVSKAFLPLLRKGTKKVIVNISSDAGCHAQNASFIHSEKPSEGGVGLSYRTSKAALNMETTVLANGLKKEKFTVIAVHPGFVITDMGNEAAELASTNQQEGYGPTMTATESVSSMLGVIGDLTFAVSGSYMQWDGVAMPW